MYPLPCRDLLTDAKLKAVVVGAEVAVREQERKVARVRGALAAAPAGALMISCINKATHAPLNSASSMTGSLGLDWVMLTSIG